MAGVSSCAVLIIDDNADDREFCRRALTKCGCYEVAEAQDGDAGLAWLDRISFDCVLLDYSLPGASGLEVLQAIRARDPHIAVVMLTGQGDVDIAVNALKQGANDYLTKAPELAARLDHVIRITVDAASHARRAERSQRYLRQMLDHIPDPIFMKDEEQRLVDGNSAFWHFLGGERDNYIGLTAEELFPPRMAVAMANAEAALFGSAAVSVAEECLPGPDGKDHIYLTKRGVFRDLDDRKLVVGVMHDVTEEREVDRIKSEFISTVSHELRTPLTSIRGALGLAAQPFAGTLSPNGRELVEIATENCERLIALINDILDIDKIASGDMRFDMALHDVADLIDQAVRTNRAYAERFGIVLKRKEFPGNCIIRADDRRVVQILSNFLSNAAKFSGRDGAVDIFVTELDGRVRIGVADRGPGIPEEFRDRVFSRFAQADSSTARTKNGSGLGLHISRQLAEAMQGSVGFETEVGVGSTFWVEFETAQMPAEIQAG